MNEMTEMIELTDAEAAVATGGNIVVAAGKFLWENFVGYTVGGFFYNTFSSEAWNAYHPGLDNRYPPIITK